MSATDFVSKISSRDRLAFTVFISLVFNATIILGVGFELYDAVNQEAPLPTLDVIIVDQQQNDEVPDDAAYLAQVNQDGDGNTEAKVRPSTRETSVPLPSPFSGDSQILQQKQSPQPMNRIKQEEILTTYAQSDEELYVQDKPERDPSEKPSSAELVAIGHEIARLQAEIAKSAQVYSQNPRERHINAATKRFEDAAYFDAWQRKVERIGNLNYPEEARRRKLAGSLTMEVSIKVDGTIEKISILRTSGKKLLDDAAVRIVRLAAPFAPFSPEMSKDTDVLHITRIWRFGTDNQLSTSAR